MHRSIGRSVGRFCWSLGSFGLPACLPVCLPVHACGSRDEAQPYLEQGDGPIVLVVAPTRELAVQIKEECD